MKIEQIKITDITEADYNPRKISKEELQKLKNSISTFGIVEPILVNLNNMRIIGGHQRYNALLDIYYTENEFNPQLNLLRLNKDFGWVFPNNEQSIINEDYEKALNLALNKISGEWDNTKLKPLLEELQIADIELELTGFDEIELSDITIDNITPQEVTEDEYEIEETIKTNIQEGDIFKLGKHTLICGDSTKEETFQKLLQNNKADMVFTDAPYDLESDKYAEHIFKHTIPNAEILIMHNERYLARLITKYDKYFRTLFTNDFRIGRLLSNKQPITQTEYIALFRKESPTRFQNLKDTFTTILAIPKTSTKNKHNFNHKHTKKVELPSEFIKHYSTEGDKILDCFGGSGTTIIACEQLNRQCYMIEIEPTYCQTIIDRWEEFTGEKAEKIN